MIYIDGIKCLLWLQLEITLWLQIVLNFLLINCCVQRFNLPSWHIWPGWTEVQLAPLRLSLSKVPVAGTTACSEGVGTTAPYHTMVLKPPWRNWHGSGVVCGFCSARPANVPILPLSTLFSTLLCVQDFVMIPIIKCVFNPRIFETTSEIVSQHNQYVLPTNQQA